MLRVEIPGQEYFDEKNEIFIDTPSVVLDLEHSLLSISKWEAKWKKPFLSKKTEKTYEESIDYIRCMTINRSVPNEAYLHIPKKIMQRIDVYINDSNTATWFSNQQQGNGRMTSEAITSELIYYWMIAHGIPFECQKWHINRLLTLIRICNIKSGKPKKMSARDAAAQRKSLNAQRRAAMHSRG